VQQISFNYVKQEAQLSQKNWDPLLISATVEASSFKFGIQLVFGTILPKNNV